MKKYLIIALLLVSAVFIFTACAGGDDSSDGDETDGDTADGDESADPVCEPGKVIECPCAGGTKGVQTCVDDGSKWGECSGCPNEDGDESDGDMADGDTVDGDAVDGDISDGDESDGDTADGDETVDGDEADGDSTDADMNENEVEMEAEAESDLPGRCSASGAPCSDEVPCETDTFDVQGFCSPSSSGTNYTCLYPPRRNMPDNYLTCGDVTLKHCESNFDCPDGIGCGGLGSEWCATGSQEIAGVCLSSATLSSGSTPCVDDSQCTQSLANICVICGNDGVETNQEECDDGNDQSGDGCSQTCQREGKCFDGSSEIFGAECADDDDCSSVYECEMSSCTCEY